MILKLSGATSLKTVLAISNGNFSSCNAYISSNSWGNLLLSAVSSNGSSITNSPNLKLEFFNVKPWNAWIFSQFWKYIALSNPLSSNFQYAASFVT